MKSRKKKWKIGYEEIVRMPIDPDYQCVMVKPSKRTTLRAVPWKAKIDIPDNL